MDKLKQPHIRLAYEYRQLFTAITRKPTVSNLLFFLLLFIIVFFSVSPAHARPRLTVRDFLDKTEEQDAPASSIMDMMVTELGTIGIFDLVERANLDYIGDEMQLGQSALADSSTALEIGKIKSAQYTMTGAITLYYYDEKGGGISIPFIGGFSQAKTAYVVLDIRIFDNITSEITYTKTKIGIAKHEATKAMVAYEGFNVGGYKKRYGGILGTAARDAVKKHVTAIREEMTGDHAAIADIQAKEVTINRGSSSGVKLGDLYLVYYGPETKYIDLAIIKVIDVRANFSYAEVVKKAGNIRVLRKSDNIIPISKEEATPIIKRNKFVNVRPKGTNTTTVANISPSVNIKQSSTQSGTSISTHVKQNNTNPNGTARRITNQQNQEPQNTAQSQTPEPTQTASASTSSQQTETKREEVSQQPPAPKPQPKTSQTSQPAQSSGNKTARIHYIVPPIARPMNLRIEVTDPSGKRDVMNKQVRSGDNINTTVSYTQECIVTIYLSGEFVWQERH